MSGSYPNIAYFVLAQDMPGALAGSMVSIIDRDGDCYLEVCEIIMPIDFANKFPQWFRSITKDIHREICRQNAIEWLMEKGRDREESAKLLDALV